MQKYKKKTTNDALKRKNEEIIVSKWDIVAEKRRNKLKEQQNQWLLIFVVSCANCDVIAMIIELTVIGLDNKSLFVFNNITDFLPNYCFIDVFFLYGKKRMWGFSEAVSGIIRSEFWDWLNRSFEFN